MEHSSSSDTTDRRQAIARAMMLGVGGMIGLGVSTSSAAKTNGIRALMAVTNEKAKEANEIAVKGASDQRRMIESARRKRVRPNKAIQSFDSEQTERFEEMSHLLKEIEANLDLIEKMVGPGCK